jgi:molybdenum ABC transporter molybdate-binding protein
VSKVVETYEQEYGVKVNIIYGGSGTLLNNISIAQKGYLYLAADKSYIDIAVSKGLLAESIPINRLRAGLAVTKGNPHGVQSLRDILDDKDLKVGLANPETASVGQFTQNVLQHHNHWEAFEERVKQDGVFTGTVNELTNHLKLKVIDVAIVWDAVAHQYREFDFISSPEFESKSKLTTIGVLKSSQQPKETLHFARYLSASDRGLVHFKKMGYHIVLGDQWANRPEITFYGGGMLRPALEKKHH